MNNSKLTKAEMVGMIGDRTGYPAAEIARVVNELFSVLSEGLASGRTAELRGFGTFEVRTRKGRKEARNPKTGEKVSVASHGVALFRPGRELKDAVRDIVR